MIRRNRMAKRKPTIRRPKVMRSGYEKRVAIYLKEMGVPFEYETLKIPFVVPEKKRTYNPDFTLPNGIIIESKGNLDRHAREKMALVVEQNPHLDIRFLFMRDNKITKQSKTKYSDWALKRGIKYHVSEQGHIPDEWLDEALAPSSLDGSTSLLEAGPKTSRGRVSKRGRSLDSVPSEAEPSDV